MRIIKYLGFVLIFSLGFSCAEAPISTQYRPGSEGRLLLGATVHLGNGKLVENAALAIKYGLVTLLTADALDQIDLTQFEVEKLGPQYHIYPFKQAEVSNSGIVLTRANAKPINISILNQEVQECITIGSEAQLLICFGSIEDISRFRVDYVVMGEEKIKILRQSDYTKSGISNNN